jgi:hypothetical protein
MLSPLYSTLFVAAIISCLPSQSSAAFTLCADTRGHTRKSRPTPLRAEQRLLEHGRGLA